VQFWRAGARLALALGYPIAIYCALLWFEPRWVAAAAVALILIRWRGRALGMFAGLSWLSHAVIACSLALSLGAVFANDETLLRLYPAAMSAALLALVRHLAARATEHRRAHGAVAHPDLPETAVRYCRHVTEVWCVFFAANAAISVWSAVAASREVWALYNGFVVYLVMGVLFAASGCCAGTFSRTRAVSFAPIAQVFARGRARTMPWSAGAPACR
jgi:uncharacterized membrane protein